MTYPEILTNTALQCLRGMICCHLRQDYEGLQFFTKEYNKVMEDITKLRQQNSNYLTDAQADYVFADMQIDATGKLISTPEHK